MAAGASIRLGEPKQLLRFKGETLLRRTSKIALGVCDNNVVVVLGANIEAARKEIEDLPIYIVDNKDWETGMSSSIKIGLKMLLEKRDELCAAIIMVCDQPFVGERLLKEIAEKFEETDSLIVACEYAHTLGVPALFSAQMFPELLALGTQTGAKQLIKKYESQIAIVQFPEGALDIDTPNDYKSLLKFS